MTRQDLFNLSLIRIVVKPDSPAAATIDALEHKLRDRTRQGSTGLDNPMDCRILLALLARQVVRAEAAEARLARVRNAIR
jgi:hypothetical protein